MEERKGGKPNTSQLNDKIAAKQNKIEQIQSQIDKGKEQAKKRKQEIDDWKQWFHSLPGTDRTEQKSKPSWMSRLGGVVKKLTLGRIKLGFWKLKNGLLEVMFLLSTGQKA